MLAPNDLTTKSDFNVDSAFYEKDDLKFHYSELIDVEEFIVEHEFVNLAFSTKKENPNFIKKSLDVYYRLTFKESNGDLKVYDISHKPKHLGHKYFYIVQNKKISRIFYHKETMIDILDQYYESDKSVDDKDISDGKINDFLCRNRKITSITAIILMYGVFIISFFSLFFKSSSFFNSFNSCSWGLLLLSLFYSGFLFSVFNRKDKLIQLNKKKEIEKLINSL